MIAISHPIAAALLLVATPSAAASDALAEPILAHPPVTGAAGPFPRATVTLRRTEPRWGAHFDGAVQAGDRRLALQGPDWPRELFLTEVKAVVFTPLGRTGPNGIVVLYDCAQIGPGHGVDGCVLAYRVTATAAIRQRALEERLSGVRTAAELRRRLAR